MSTKASVGDVEDDFEKMATTFFETYPLNVPEVLKPKAKIDLVEMLRAAYRAGVQDEIDAREKLEEELRRLRMGFSP